MPFHSCRSFVSSRDYLLLIVDGSREAFNKASASAKPEQWVQFENCSLIAINWKNIHLARWLINALS